MMVKTPRVLLLFLLALAAGCRNLGTTEPPPSPQPPPVQPVPAKQRGTAPVQQAGHPAMTVVPGQQVGKRWVPVGVGIMGMTKATLATPSSLTAGTRPAPDVSAAIPREGQKPLPTNPDVSHGARCPEGCMACMQVIEKGLAYLLAMQKTDGRWESGRHMDYGFVETALCGLAFLAEGSTTERGSRDAYRDALRKAVDFLATRIDEEGQLRDPAREKRIAYSMSSLEVWRASFTAMFLAEIYRKDNREDLEPKLRLLGNRLAHLQRETGGYCHDLRPRVVKGPNIHLYYSEDLVVATNVVVLALHALEEAGIPVSRQTLAGIRSYYSKVQNPDGGFKYGLMHIYRPAESSERGRTLGAVLALLLLGTEQGDEAIQDALAYVDEGFATIHESPIHRNYVYTVNVFLAALACQALGEERWGRFVARFFPWIQASQYEEGYIRPQKTAREGLIDTAFLLITLQLGKGTLSCTGTGACQAAGRGDPAPAARVSVRDPAIQRRDPALARCLLTDRADSGNSDLLVALPSE